MWLGTRPRSGVSGRGCWSRYFQGNCFNRGENIQVVFRYYKILLWILFFILLSRLSITISTSNGRPASFVLCTTVPPLLLLPIYGCWERGLYYYCLCYTGCGNKTSPSGGSLLKRRRLDEMVMMTGLEYLRFFGSFHYYFTASSLSLSLFGSC